LSAPVHAVVDKQIAVFGEASFKLTDTFKATAGLRPLATRLRRIGSGNGAVARHDNQHPLELHREAGHTRKQFYLWQPDRDDLVYVSASKGFRPGGPNVPVGPTCGGNLAALGLTRVPGQYASDSCGATRSGARTPSSTTSCRSTPACYYIDWNGIQQNVYLPGCGQQYTANLGKARSEGGEHRGASTGRSMC